MKILVPVKRVIDYNVKPRVKADGKDAKGRGGATDMRAARRKGTPEMVLVQWAGAVGEEAGDTISGNTTGPGF